MTTRQPPPQPAATAQHGGAAVPRRRFIALAAAWSASGCAGLRPAPPPADAVLAPNAQLVAQGLPPLPMSLVRRIEPYSDFRGHAFVDWHPTRRELLVAHRAAGASTPQLYRVAAPGAEPVALTQGPEPVTTASWEPLEGRYIVFERAAGGNEADQLHRLDPATGQSTLLTDPDQRHSLGPWLHGSPRLLYTSVPLDRTAAGGTRESVQTRLSLLDPADPASQRVVAQLEGPGWWPGGVSPDDRWLALTRYVSAAESQVWRIELASGRLERLLPAPAETLRALHWAGDFTADGRGLWVLTDRAGEFREAARLDLATGRIDRLTGHIPWDVSGQSASADGTLLAMQVNVDGRDELRLFDGASCLERAVPAVPPGSVGTAMFHRRRGELAFSLNSAQGPSRLWTLDAASGRVEPWTTPHAPAGIDMQRFGEQRIVRWRSFDGRTISGLLSLPPPRFAGPRPVLVDIHGGPEAQATMGFMGRYNYLIDELGVAILQPNVRGSSGFGKTFLTLDNGFRREDSVKDIGAALDWIASQPGLDASRVAVSGGSYGGYMSLAVSVMYGERIASAIAEVGISHFITFLRNTESYRRDLRRVEYGDERDPAMAEFLHRISPLTNAQRIRRPLFVIHGRNDPRVPHTEAEQIVERVRANGVPVWYLLALNEGHGFMRKENADYRFYAIVAFLTQTLRLGPAG